MKIPRTYQINNIFVPPTETKISHTMDAEEFSKNKKKERKKENLKQFMS